MSTIRLRLGDDVFDIPVVGASNWGEQITLYLRKNSEIIENIQGPQDILLTSDTLQNGVSIEAPEDVKGLNFNTNDIQNIIVDGYIKRTITGDVKVDSFRCEGIYDSSNFHVDINYTGTDTGVRIFPDEMGTGQFKYTSEDVANTTNIQIFFRAKTIIEE
jgi:hypothetical protein